MAKQLISKDRLIEIRNKLKMSEKLIEEELQPIAREALLRYTGKHVPSFGNNWDIVLNEVYPIIQTELPSIFFRNPYAYLKPRNKTFIKKQRNPISGKMEEIQADSEKSAKTQEAILNYSLSQIPYKRETRRTLLDALLLPYGVLWHGYKGDWGMTDESSIFVKNDNLFVQRVSPFRFLFDPSCTIANYDEGSFVARIIDVPLQDIIDDKYLNVTKELKGFVGFGDKVGRNTIEKSNGADQANSGTIKKPLIDFTDKEFKESNGSKFLRVYEVFVRPTKKERYDGKEGYILLLTDEQKEPLRENTWSIKAEGFPGHVLQFNELPESLFGISDIDVYKQIADQKNIIINQQIQNAQQTGKIWVGLSKEGADEEDIEAVQQGQNTIVKFESGDPRQRMFIASAGGQASSELYTLDQRIQGNLDNASGINDLKRGVLRSGEESATSVKYRAMGSSIRPQFRQDIMSDFLKGSFLYCLQILKQFVPVTQAVRIIGSLDLEWSDNPSKEELQADVDVEIDPISMLPENPDEELNRLNQTLMLMINGLTNPDIRMKLQQEGKTLNLSPLIEQILYRQKIRNPEIFRNIKPEESMGFVSVQQLREAEANVQSIVAGQPIQFPPKEGDDHVAKIETYNSILQLAGQNQMIAEFLQTLIMQHQALLEELQSKSASVGSRSTKPSVQNV